MLRPRNLRLGLGMVAALAVGARAEDGPVLEPPLVAEAGVEGEAGSHDLAILQDVGIPAREPVASLPHESTGQARDAAAVRVPKAPPPPIAERPTGDRPSPDAEWAEGYWSWDPQTLDFAWVAGSWRVPPAGQFWVNGSWRRDDRGWVRTPGFWSARKTDRADWRTQGPPTDCPEEAVGNAPGPDYFHVDGHYAPDGSGVSWKAGFWAKAQPGWEWTPARWVRLADGWSFREGRWVRPASDVVLASRLPAADEIVPPSETVAVAPAGGLVETRAIVANPAPAPVPVLMPMPAPSMLIPLADRLAGESESFVRAIAANARILNESGAFIAEGRRVQAAALRLRQVAATDPARVGWELRNLDASWQDLYARVRRVSRGRAGPFVQLALRMGATTGEILRQGQ